MDLCSSGHDEICFEGRFCPVCEIIKEKDNEIKALEDDLAQAKSEIDSLVAEQ